MKQVLLQLEILLHTIQMYVIICEESRTPENRIIWEVFQRILTRLWTVSLAARRHFNTMLSDASLVFSTKNLQFQYFRIYKIQKVGVPSARSMGTHMNLTASALSASIFIEVAQENERISRGALVQYM